MSFSEDPRRWQVILRLQSSSSSSSSHLRRRCQVNPHIYRCAWDWWTRRWLWVLGGAAASEGQVILGLHTRDVDSFPDCRCLHSDLGLIRRCWSDRLWAPHRTDVGERMNPVMVFHSEHKEMILIVIELTVSPPCFQLFNKRILTYSTIEYVHCSRFVISVMWLNKTLRRPQFRSPRWPRPIR